MNVMDIDEMAVGDSEPSKPNQTIPDLLTRPLDLPDLPEIPGIPGEGAIRNFGNFCLKRYKLEKILNFLQGLCINLSVLQTIGKYFKYKQRTSDAE